MFVSPAYVVTVALLSLRSFVFASPLVTRAAQGAWTPPVTAPQAGDVWTIGSTQLVTWDTHEIPPSASNKTGILLLGYFDDSEGENLDMGHPLASDFLLIDGCVHVEVPDVEPRDTYIVVLMGNSGNSSPEFTIIKRSSASTTSYRASNSSDRVVAQKDTKGLRTRQLPPDFPALPALPVSPTPPIVPSPQFPDPGVLPIGSEASSKDASAPSS